MPPDPAKTQSSTQNTFHYPIIALHCRETALTETATAPTKPLRLAAGGKQIADAPLAGDVAAGEHINAKQIHARYATRALMFLTMRNKPKNSFLVGIAKSRGCR